MNAHEYQRKRLARAAAKLGDEIESAFVATHGGLATYLLACARDEASHALMTLADVDPTDHETIRKLQNQVQRHRDLTTWMAQAAENGRDAWLELDEGEQEAIASTIDPQESED